MQKRDLKKTTGAKKTLSKAKKNIKVKASNVKLLILDVDGVMTDGGIILDDNGTEYKIFDVRDGHGIKLLTRKGIRVAIITGRQSDVVTRRAEELGIEEVYQRCLNKVVAYEDIKEKLSLTDRDIAYIGDDVVDIPIMRRAGLSVAVADAHKDITEFADILTEAKGGKGAVREISEFILHAKGLWEDILHGYIEA